MLPIPSFTAAGAAAADAAGTPARLLQELPELALLPGDAARTVKLQWNRGGGSFPCHFDNPGPPSARQLSCILYLNPGWAPAQGGRLVLTPFLQPAVALAPLHNRAVFFLSDRVLHSVEPSGAERFCVTTWVDGAAANLPEHCSLRARPAPPPCTSRPLASAAAPGKRRH